MLYPYNCDDITYTYCGSVSIVRSPGLSSSLQWLGTSDMGLNKVQVATSLDFFLGKYVFIRLLAGKSV